ncbi:hypothetical protein SDJN03_00541, partial [Cucurbita argyrosperma subsp. sororia]
MTPKFPIIAKCPLSHSRSLHKQANTISSAASSHRYCNFLLLLTLLPSMDSKAPKRRFSELPPRRGQILIGIFKSIFRTGKPMPEGFESDRRKNESLTLSPITPATNSSGYNSEVQSES